METRADEHANPSNPLPTVQPTEEELSALDDVIGYVVDTIQHEKDAVVEHNLDLLISLQNKLLRIA